MNALRRIHAALVPGGLVIDTQPVSPHPPVEADAGALGRLDMREWARTVATIDRLVASTIADGLFAIVAEQRFVVTETFGDGREAVDVVEDWQGTVIPAAVAARVAAEPGPVRVHQDVRMRVFRAS